MKCEKCGEDSKHFVVLKITNEGPEMVCSKCYNKMKKEKQNENN